MAYRKRMDPAYYKFVYVPVVFIVGLIIVSELIKTAIPNDFFRYFLIGTGLLGALALYYKKQLQSFFK